MSEHQVVEDAINSHIFGPNTAGDDAHTLADSARIFGDACIGESERNLLAQNWLPHIFADPDFRACVEACDKILAVKGKDYTQGSVDRLANFYEAGKFMQMTPFQTLGTYFYKHLTAIFSYLKHGKVESEPIEGRIHDAINYLMLLYKMVNRERVRQGEEVDRDQ